MKFKFTGKLKLEKGFTLIELLIVIAMTALLTTLMLANFRSGDKQKRVAFAADGVASMIRVAQNYTLSGKQIPENAIMIGGSRCLDDNSAKMFGVYVSSGELYPGSGNILILAEDNCGATMIVDKFNIPAGTRIRQNGITISGCPACATSPTFFVLSFTPPFASMTVGSVVGVNISKFSNIDVVLETDDGVRSKTVKIDGISGRISN